jgi:hypothetical protein
VFSRGLLLHSSVFFTNLLLHPDWETLLLLDGRHKRAVGMMKKFNEIWQMRGGPKKYFELIK